ncbi:MAG: alpha/beta hydrolase family protein [Firmicutes bacterium]|nr:alpha/beta hydrolase family protein [Bacillota bacterium]MDD4693685.1 alpha/beta hydrolase family protein [Bacillota bacterium]
MITKWGWLILLLAITTSSAVSAKTFDVTHFSESLQKEKTFRIILPESYHEENFYPTLYLLHGATGNYTDWHKDGVLEDLAKAIDMIIVTPDGENSWYLNSPVKAESKYESYIMEDLIPYVEANFNAIDTYRARGIAGLSMGGHGAISLAMKHPEFFGTASSLSGVLDLTFRTAATGLIDILGDIEDNLEVWEDNSAIKLTGNLRRSKRRPKMLFDVGMSDTYYKPNLDFHIKLKSLGLEHTFKVFPGSHNWEYWLSHLQEHLEFHAKNLRKPLIGVEGE